VCVRERHRGVCVRVHACACVRVHACACVLVCVCLCVCLCACACVHVHASVRATACVRARVLVSARVRVLQRGVGRVRACALSPEGARVGRLMRSCTRNTDGLGESGAEYAWWACVAQCLPVLNSTVTQSFAATRCVTMSQYDSWSPHRPVLTSCTLLPYHWTIAHECSIAPP
jgi:hypothetical protein